MQLPSLGNAAVVEMNDHNENADCIFHMDLDRTGYYTQKPFQPLFLCWFIGLQDRFFFRAIFDHESMRNRNSS